jgi:hypothetical protein
MCAGYIVDNLGSPGIGETLPKFRQVKKTKKKVCSIYPLWGGRLTDKLIVKLGLLHYSIFRDFIFCRKRVPPFNLVFSNQNYTGILIVLVKLP